MLYSRGKVETSIITHMAKVIEADGKEYEVAPNDSKKFTLSEMQHIVGGTISIVLGLMFLQANAPEPSRPRECTTMLDIADVAAPLCPGVQNIKK